MSLDNEDVILSDDELLRVTTDLDDYAPGSTAIITATGVDVGGSVTFEVEHVSDAGADGIYGTADDTTVDLGGDGHDSWTVVDGGAGDLDGEANGVIVTEWYVNPDDSLDETFLLSADSGTDSAYWSFTDGVIEITTQSSGYVLPSSGADGYNGADNQTELDLTATDSPTYVETVSGAIWTNNVFGAGTGVIDPFVRIQSNSNQDGVNTSGDINNDEKAQANGYTSDLLLSEVGLFNATNSDVLNDVGATGNYYEFRLDINENSNSNGDQYISLDDVMFFVSDTPLLTLPSGTNVIDLTAAEIEALLEGSQGGANVELVYDLDALGDTWVALNYDLQAGSGVGDIALYIEQGDFTAARNLLGTANDATYVYLVSSMGYQGTGLAPLLTADDEYDAAGGTEQAKWQSSDGFEEWSILKNAVQPVAIKGWKFNDLDGVVTPTESDPLGLAGWQILLYEDTNGDDIWDPNVDGEVRRVTTDENGFYQFDGLVAGTPYFLVEVAPTVDLSGVTAAQLLDVDWRLDGWIALDDDPSGVLGSFTIDSGLFIGSSDPVNDYNSGTNFHNFKLFDISGKKVEDMTGDGVTGDDQGWGGVTIQIVDGDTVVAETTTASDGSFLFENLDYTYAGLTVREVLPDGSYQTLGTANPSATYTITGTSGADQAGLNFSNVKYGKISGQKLEDNDGDAGTTDDQTGENGWTINLYKDGVLQETTTTATVNGVVGYYEFDNLELGNYTVEEVSQTGWINLTDLVVTAEGTTTSGFHSMGNNFVNTEKGSISGIKLEDLNANGVEDANENAGIDGITIVLLDESGAEVAQTETAGGGMWSFDNLAPGTYSVYEVIDGVYYSTAPTQIDRIEVSSGEDETGYIFLNWTPGKIEGNKSYDATLGSDFGLEGWEITLANADGSAVLDADGNVVGPVYTNGDGNFEFVNLKPGTYVVTEATPTGWTATSSTSYTVTVTSGATVEEDIDGDGIDFLNKSSVIIGGEKREDADADGDFGDADAGLEDWTINIWYDAAGDGLERGDDDVLITAMTNADGEWSATLHDVGNYYVEEVDQAGWTQSSTPETYMVTVSYDADTGNDPEDLEFNPGLEVTTSDRTSTTLDFLNYQSGGITGEKYYGATGYGLVGWKVALYAADADPATDAPIATTLTGAGGVYSFANLDPGQYLVVESMPDGWDAYDGAPTQHLVTVTSGETTGIDSDATDFRNISEITIGGTKYEDKNADGSTEGDSALTDVSFTIQVWKDGQAEGEDGHGEIGLGDTLIASPTTSGVDGTWSYTLEDLGSYIVRELVTTGWTQSYPASSTYSFDVVYDPDLDDSDATYDPGLKVVGADRDNLDFANWAPGTITGEKYYGAGTDTPLVGWEVSLYEADADGNPTGDAIQVTKTDGDGVYLFEDVDPGRYVVVETVPENWSSLGNEEHLVTVTSREDVGVDSIATDFHNESEITIGGSKYIDHDADGDIDDVGTYKSLSDEWVITVYKDDGNGTFGAEDGVYVSTNTASGDWTATLSALGTYFIVEELTADQIAEGWTQSYPFDPGYHTAVVGYDSDLDNNPDTFDPGLVLEDTQPNQTYDFGNWKPGEIEGKKYYFGAGTEDGEVPLRLEGWLIELYETDADGNATGDPIRTATTDVDGNFRFENVDPGDYIVREVLPTLGETVWTAGAPGVDRLVTVTSGNTTALSVVSLDFYNRAEIEIGGTKYVDVMGDGLDDTDTGHPDTPFTIRIVYDENGNDQLDATDVADGDTFIVEVETDTATGEWSYDLSRLGTYFVLEVGEDGWEQTFPALNGYYTLEVSYSANVDGDDATYDPGLVVTSDSRTKDTLDFANFEEFSVTGIKWNDITGNGYDIDDTTWSGAGVVIYIDANGDGDRDWTDGNGNEVWDEGEGERWTVTGEGGAYSFDGLTLDYVGEIIREEVPVGTTQTGDTLYHVIENPGSGETGTGYDFTNFINFSLTGAKILDLNGNGQVDAGEAGAPVNPDGSTQIVRLGLFIDDGAGNLTAVLRDGINYEVNSTGAGTFAFTDLGPLPEGQSYVVREVGYFEQPSDGGSLIRFPDGAGGNEFWVQTSNDITVTPESGGGEAAGSVFNSVLNFELGRIEGKKFWDHDRDGTFEEADGEDWAEGWVIRLWKDAQQEGDAGYGVLDDFDLLIEQDVSDANGDWAFGGLMTGTYFIEEEMQAGYVQTTPDLLGDGYFKVTIDSSGQVVLTADADSPTSYPELPNDGKLWFGNDQIEGPGVRTPGFWQSDLGQTFWDGDNTNDGDHQNKGVEKTGDEFAEDDVFWLNYTDEGDVFPQAANGELGLLVGDWNTNGVTDPGEETIFYTLDEALEALQSQSGTTMSGKKGKNTDYAGVSKIERDVVASWLNVLAGNPENSEVGGQDVEDWINDAILYINAYKSGSGLSPKDLRAAWNNGIEDLDGDGDLEVGSEIHNALDGWNNWGELAGTPEAFDGDNAYTAVSQSYYESLA